MRNLEIHAFDDESDLDSAIQWGIVEHFDSVSCVSCDTPLGHSAVGEFARFCLVIDDEDAEWFVCLECAEPVVYGVNNEFFTRFVKTTYTGLLEEDLDFD